MISTCPLALRSAAGFHLAVPGVEPKAKASMDASMMSTVPSWFRSGVLVTMQLAGLPTLTVQLAASINGTAGMLSTNFRLLLIAKERLKVKVLEKIVAPVVLLTSVRVTVALKVLAVVSTVIVPDTFTVTPSKLIVWLNDVV